MSTGHVPLNLCLFKFPSLRGRYHYTWRKIERQQCKLLMGHDSCAVYDTKPYIFGFSYNLSSWLCGMQLYHILCLNTFLFPNKSQEDHCSNPHLQMLTRAWFADVWLGIRGQSRKGMNAERPPSPCPPLTCLCPRVTRCFFCW